MSTTTLAIPGQLLGPASKFQPGPGTHIHDSNLDTEIVGNAEGIVEAVTILFNRFAGPGALAGCVICTVPSSDEYRFESWM